MRSNLMDIYRHLIFKKSLANMAKERAQESYLEALQKPQEMEQVSLSWRFRL